MSITTEKSKTATSDSPTSTGKAYQLILEAGRADKQYWWDLWKYRELLLILTLRDISVRYKQTVIGIAWAVVRPVLTAIILVVIFGQVANLPSGGVPYPLLVLSGMLAWQLFSTGMSSASESLVANANLVSKIYFPRLIVPLSSVGVSLVDFLVTLPVFFAAMLWYQYVPGWQILLLPLFILLAVLAALSVGLWLCAVNVKYRDFRYALPFFVQFGLYVTPVGFSLAAVKERSEALWWIMTLNPATGVIEGFRWSLLGQVDGFNLLSFGLSLSVVTVLLVTGLWYFRSTEKTFADVI